MVIQTSTLKKINFISCFFSADAPLAAISFLSIIMLSALSCNKDNISPVYSQPLDSLPVTMNKNIFFSVDFLGKPFISYGELGKNIPGTGFQLIPSLEVLSGKDSTGETITEIKITVEHLVGSVLGHVILGNVGAYFRLAKKGAGITGLYTTQLKYSDLYYYPAWISFPTASGGMSSVYDIDSSGIEFNIVKEGISDIDGAYVEGNFKFKLYEEWNPGALKPVIGTFRLYKY